MRLVACVSWNKAPREKVKLYQIPQGWKDGYCRARDIVKVSTPKGWQLAVCQCDEFKLRDNLIQLFDTSVQKSLSFNVVVSHLYDANKKLVTIEEEESA